MGKESRLQTARAAAEGQEPCNPVGGSPTMPHETACVTGSLFTVRTLPLGWRRTVAPEDPPPPQGRVRLS
jgi:hypothetical protein